MVVLSSSTSVKLIVKVAESLKDPSDTLISKLKVGVVSKSSAELFATVNIPVSLSKPKA